MRLEPGTDSLNGPSENPGERVGDGRARRGQAFLYTHLAKIVLVGIIIVIIFAVAISTFMPGGNMFGHFIGGLVDTVSGALHVFTSFKFPSFSLPGLGGGSSGSGSTLVCAAGSITGTAFKCAGTVSSSCNALKDKDVCTATPGCKWDDSGITLGSCVRGSGPSCADISTMTATPTVNPEDVCKTFGCTVSQGSYDSGTCSGSVCANPCSPLKTRDACKSLSACQWEITDPPAGYGCRIKSGDSVSCSDTESITSSTTVNPGLICKAIGCDWERGASGSGDVVRAKLFDKWDFMHNPDGNISVIFPIKDLSTVGMNDKTRSVKVNKGPVVLWTDTNFAGKKLTLAGDANDLNVGGQIQSVKIHGSSCTLQLYTKAQFQGRELTCDSSCNCKDQGGGTGSCKDLKSINIPGFNLLHWDKVARSGKVTGGSSCTATVYGQSDWNGKYMTITGDSSTLVMAPSSTMAGVQPQTSSIQVPTPSFQIR